MLHGHRNAATAASEVRGTREACLPVPPESASALPCDLEWAPALSEPLLTPPKNRATGRGHSQSYRRGEKPQTPGGDGLGSDLLLAT